ncbi:hypothetical protein EI555_002830 [Monodon monoceros]|uniref:Uncharacterized protein n=1 Tax=Monodon monoceros TaxID=40151 RepID=A0A4U1ECB8_MONMO|nr:hypothetical protein EI555_002830 [Monodon monoceros]
MDYYSLLLMQRRNLYLPSM